MNTNIADRYILYQGEYYFRRRPVSHQLKEIMEEICQIFKVEQRQLKKHYSRDHAYLKKLFLFVTQNVTQATQREISQAAGLSASGSGSIKNACDEIAFWLAHPAINDEFIKIWNRYVSEAKPWMVPDAQHA